jgi:hypothetical protein
MPPIDEWADQFEQGDEDMDSLFSDWGKQWKILVDYLRERVNIIQFHLSDTQKERFNSGIKRVVYKNPYPDEFSMQLFDEAGIIVEKFEE